MTGGGSSLAPGPVFLDMKREYGRDKRGTVRDYNNMLLNQPVIDNELRPDRWHGHGFQGHVQYIPYVGRDEIRPGEKLVRDIQVPTFPKEMVRPLNRTQMARATIQIRDFASEKNNPGHDAYMATMRENQKLATAREFSDNPYIYSTDIKKRTQEGHDLNARLTSHMKDLRPAGLASINPTLGTSGMTENLVGNAGPSAFDKWRVSAPWAFDKTRNKIFDYTNPPC
eukprot:CAMPEP_0179009020 /NCGR_PEP_ID=MMETSP0795-20121207/16048_1 /TAXON_ID=88552 /ORGANISM="Amoebophrya sp., Strain Ameob2" /LENGTH=225 /DNA_ID=CAMNT_0020704187 /DNA_START=106 /DNA_END=783 /DNA_ORIENTATION=+